MPSSDTPGSEREFPQGPADWSREKPSDDQLSERARLRISEVLAWLARQGR